MRKLWTNLKYYPRIWLVRLMKPTKNLSQYNWCPDKIQTVCLLNTPSDKLYCLSQLAHRVDQTIPRHRNVSNVSWPLAQLSENNKNAIFWDVAPCISCVNLLTLVPRSRIFLHWRWRRYVPPKRRFTQDLHGATSQKTAFFIVTAVKTSNITTWKCFLHALISMNIRDSTMI
jgi:hypothetical protein